MEKLILLHGALGSADQMIPLQKTFSNAFEVYNFEFDGHGKKSAMEGGFSTSNFVSQLDSFIASLSGSVHLLGYSMGGFIALMSAARGNKAIQSITTLGTKMLWDVEIAKSEIRRLDPDKIKEKVPAFFEALRDRHGEYWVEVLNRTSNFMESLGSSNPITKESMSEVKCPVQLLLGEKDQMVSLEETQHVANWINESVLYVLAGGEHPIEKVDTSILAKLLIDFCRMQ